MSRGGSKSGGRRHFSSLEWYAYKHQNGTIHTRRYFGDRGDIVEAQSSPFVRQVTGPFEAKNKEVANDIATARLI
jgi:hypothetical protein